jgi:hypothetical protein
MITVLHVIVSVMAIAKVMLTSDGARHLSQCTERKIITST